MNEERSSEGGAGEESDGDVNEGRTPKGEEEEEENGGGEEV